MVRYNDDQFLVMHSFERWFIHSLYPISKKGPLSRICLLFWISKKKKKGLSAEADGAYFWWVQLNLAFFTGNMDTFKIQLVNFEPKISKEQRDQ